MDKQIKWAGAALVAGGLLMFTRMAPILAVLPEDMAFPPESTQEMIRLAEIAGSGWQWSHLMGLAAVLLFAIAYGWHAQVLIRLGWKRIGLATAVAATAAFGLFAIALFLDGFIVPATIESYMSAAGDKPATLEQVADSHSFALRFFTPAVFLMFVAAGLLSSPMLHRVIHVRWLGIVGQAIAVIAVTAYLTGITGPDWNNMQIAGTLMMAVFSWHLLLGSRTLFFMSRQVSLDDGR